MRIAGVVIVGESLEGDGVRRSSRLEREAVSSSQS
jgi:hypothetical protein